jgi:hypothetical protein
MPKAAPREKARSATPAGDLGSGGLVGAGGERDGPAVRWRRFSSASLWACPVSGGGHGLRGRIVRSVVGALGDDMSMLDVKDQCKILCNG